MVNFQLDRYGKRSGPVILWLALFLASMANVWLPGRALAQSFDITEQCFAVADERSGVGGDSLDTLVRLNRNTGQSFVIGLTGTLNIEAIAFGPSEILYGIDGGQMGPIDLASGLFTPLPARFGIAGGSAGEVNLNDVDAVSYDVTNDLLYGVQRRRLGLTDLLFVIDRQTGAHIPNFYGPNMDYLEVTPIIDMEGRRLDDVDDIAIDPVSGIMYAAINSGGAGGELAIIDPATGVAARVATFRYPDPNPQDPVTSGQIIDDLEGLSFFNNGQLYGSTGNNGPDKIDLNKLFIIDKLTGIGTEVGPFPAGLVDYEGLGCLTEPAFITLKKFTNGPGQLPADADEPTGPTITVGDPVTWTYAFTNTGALTLTNLVLTDDQIGQIGPDGVSNCPPATTILGPGEGMVCTATGIAQSGQYANIATITGLSQEGLVAPRIPVSDTDPSHYFGDSPNIDIEKLTNGQDADDPNGGDVPQIPAGGTVTWTYIVTNTGNVAFNESQIVVTDDQLGPVTTIIDKGNGNTLLEPGESWVYQTSGLAADLLHPTPDIAVVPGCDPTNSGITRLAYSNIGIVTAGNAAAYDPSHYCNTPAPGIDIEKLTNGRDADDENGSDVPIIEAGDSVTWTYIVRNIGNIIFNESEITVTDDILGVVTGIVDKGDGDNLLAPDESWIYEVVGIADNLSLTSVGVLLEPSCDSAQSGQLRPTYRNVGTVIARSETDADPSHYCNPPAPGIDIEKLTNDRDADGPDDVDVPEIAPGATVTWTYVVTNTGDVNFAESEITVTDDVLGVITGIVDKGDGDNILAPGEAWMYQAVGVAQNLLLNSDAVNVVAGCDPDQTGFTRPTYRNIGTVVARQATELDVSHYCNPHIPGIDIEKLTNGFDADDPNDPDVPQIAPGNTVTWTYVVTNVGDLAFDASEITVTDNILGAITNIVDRGDGDDTLAPGERWIYQAIGVAQNLLTDTTTIEVVPGCNPAQNGLERPTYRNIGTVVVKNATDLDASHYCNAPDPALELQKLTNGFDADDPNGPDVPVLLPGEPIIWTYIITNTGNVPFAQADIVLVDDTIGPITTIASQGDGDAILSPGESWTYTATGEALSLSFTNTGVTIVEGCSRSGEAGTRPTYRNMGAVRVNTTTASDPSHYCNRPPAALGETDEPLSPWGQRIWLPLLLK